MAQQKSWVVAGCLLLALTGCQRGDSEQANSSEPTTRPANAHISPMTHRSHGVTSLAISSDGSQLLAGTRYCYAVLWDVTSGKELRRFAGHEHWITGVAMNAERILTISEDRVVRLWDRNNGDTIRTFAHPLDGAQQIRGSNDSAPSAAFFSNGQKTLTTAYPSGAVVWDTVSGEQQNEFVITWEFCSATHPNKTQVILGSFDLDTGIEAAMPDLGTLYVWDAANATSVVPTDRPRPIVEELIGEITRAAWAPDRHWVLTNSEVKSAFLWDVQTAEKLHTFPHDSNVSAVALHASTARAVTGCQDGSMFVWDANTGDLLLTLQAHTDRVSSVVFTEAGDRCATGSLDGTAILWDLSTGDELRRFSVPQESD